MLCAEESGFSFDRILLWHKKTLHNQKIKQNTQKQYLYNSYLINDEKICKFVLSLIFSMFNIFSPFHFSCYSLFHYFVTHYLLLCYSVKEHPCPNIPWILVRLFHGQVFPSEIVCMIYSCKQIVSLLEVKKMLSDSKKYPSLPWAAWTF